VLEHAFFHLDAVGQIRHLDLLFSLERLRGIQCIPSDGQPPSEEWLPLLKRIRKDVSLLVAENGQGQIAGGCPIR
jgi:hypothetical protein